MTSANEWEREGGGRGRVGEGRIGLSDALDVSQKRVENFLFDIQVCLWERQGGGNWE